MYLPKLHLCSIGAQVTYAQACGGALQIRFGIMQERADPNLLLSSRERDLKEEEPITWIFHRSDTNRG